MFRIVVILLLCLSFIQVLPNVVADEEEEGISSNSSNENKKERLLFGGLLESQSKPLPADVSRNSLIKFFKEEQETNIILIASAGGDRATERISRTAELDQYWYQCCQDTYGQENLPSDSDPIYATNTTTRYPGLFQLTTTTYNGIKTFIPTNNDDDNEMPRYDLLMIAEQQRPKGLPPVVWAFHKICGFCAGRDSLEPCGRVQGSVSIVKVNDAQYAFSFSVNIQIRIDFPKKLMKIMPMKKENAESLVSKVILKAISKDIDRNLDAFYDLFMKWFNDKPDGGGGESESKIEAPAPDSTSSRDEKSEL